MTMKDIYSNKSYPGSKPARSTNDYPPVKDIDYEKFILTADRLPYSQRKEALNQAERYIQTQQQNFMGYQANQELDYSNELAKFLDYHINNIGDPFQSGNFTVNSKFLERAVLDYFASLWNAKWPHEEKNDNISIEERKESYWGYVLSMGSSEGNIYALWNARDYLSGKFLLLDKTKNQKIMASSADGMVHTAGLRYKNFDASNSIDDKNKFTPIAFYSENTHYSIIKNMRILGIKTFFDEAEQCGYECPLKPEDYPDGYSPQYISETGWPYEVPSNMDGSVYIPALIRLVEFFAKLGYPPLVIFNYGSTFKGALDNVKGAIDGLVPVLKKNNLYEQEVEYEKDSDGKPLTDKRTGFWFHVDGALGAGYVPFLRKAKEKAGEADNLPIFDFSIKELHSITMSGHKWIGAPWPCGIFMSKVKYQLMPVDDPAYIGSSDSTFSGSRNGFSSLILWDFISRHSVDELAARAKKPLELIDYFMRRFREVEEYHKGRDLWLEHSPNAITVRFKKLNDNIVYKYSLSNESLYVNGEQRNYSHIFMMNQMTVELIDRFIDDLKTEDAFPLQLSDVRFNSKMAADLPHNFDEIIVGSGLGFK